MLTLLVCESHCLLAPLSINQFIHSRGVRFSVIECVQVNDLVALGMTNFGEAFEAAFTMLDESAAALQGEFTYCGETILMFLTDGEPSIGIQVLWTE